MLEPWRCVGHRGTFEETTRLWSPSLKKVESSACTFVPVAQEPLGTSWEPVSYTCTTVIITIGVSLQCMKGPSISESSSVSRHHEEAANEEWERTSLWLSPYQKLPSWAKSTYLRRKIKTLAALDFRKTVAGSIVTKFTNSCTTSSRSTSRSFGTDSGFSSKNWRNWSLKWGAKKFTPFLSLLIQQMAYLYPNLLLQGTISTLRWILGG